MPELTPGSLGLAKVMTGLGPRDFAYRGLGYSIEPVTRRFWRLQTFPGRAPIATAGTLGQLLTRLDSILHVGQDLDQRAQQTQQGEN